MTAAAHRPWLLLAPALVLLAVLLVAPMLVMTAYSFFEYVDIGVERPAFELKNWADFLRDPYYHYGLAKTARVALISTVASVVLGYVPALVIASTRSRGRWLLMLLLLLPFWISFVIRTMSWIQVLGANGLINAVLISLGLIDAPLELLYREAAVVMGLVHFLLPFTILNIFVALEGIDANLVPAARTLGASSFQAFLQVTLPLSLPGVATAALLAFVLAAGSYVTPLILGGPGDFLFGNLIYSAVMTELNWPLGATLAIALTVILAALLLIYNRFFGVDRLARGLS
ncbi:ABC transporter permease [Enterovirga sp. CN4-39]|uniref:ABC transporter permease n=1 Tax=Enterovirga sp. CN4-39 TaxID=3400910 RepID=UPI003C09D7B8